MLRGLPNRRLGLRMYWRKRGAALLEKAAVIDQAKKYRE